MAAFVQRFDSMMQHRRTPIVSETRSRIMRAVRSKDTQPERRVRSLLWRMDYRYRLHASGLPGRPDVVFARRRKVVFVHGCFWHQHPGCSKATVPKTRTRYWVPKLKRNRKRDLHSIEVLNLLGWGVLVVWQCQMRNETELLDMLRRFLGPARYAA